MKIKDGILIFANRRFQKSMVSSHVFALGKTLGQPNRLHLNIMLVSKNLTIHVFMCSKSHVNYTALSHQHKTCLDDESLLC